MRDEWFIRGQVPMTKSEVRAVSLSKLELDETSVLWDIGAGTGSVSIEAAFCHGVKAVYAFEKNAEAVELLRRNREKAGTAGQNINIIEGTVPDSILALQAGEKDATHAFIGGTAGHLSEVIELLWDINPDMRIVINVIALESLAAVIGMLNSKGIEAEVVSVQIARAEKMGSYHLMKGQNPVFVISFGGEKTA